MNWLNAWFGFDRHGTSLGRELVAGLTTFTTMSYIVVVNPAILSTAGIPEGPSFVATVLVAAFGCYLMAFYANRPFAIAPYMGENAFIAFTVCKLLGFRWQTALAAILIAGVLFVLMTLLRLRQWIVDGVPTSLRYSFAVGIGLFLTFIGLNQTGLVTLGVPGAPVQAGHLTSHPALVAMFGFVLIAVLVIRKVPGAILLGIIVTAMVAFIARTAPPPRGLVSIPPTLAPIVWQLDLRGAFAWRAFPVVLTIFIMEFVDTMGTLIGLSARVVSSTTMDNFRRSSVPCWWMRSRRALLLSWYHDRRCVRAVGHRNRGWRAHRLYRLRHRNLFPAGAVLFAVCSSHSSAGLWTCFDHRWPVHAGAHNPR